MAGIKIIKKPLDPIATRISLGGNLKDGYYCVYRGELRKVKDILMNVVLALDEMDQEPEIDYSEVLSE